MTSRWASGRRRSSSKARCVCAGYDAVFHIFSGRTPGVEHLLVGSMVGVSRIAADNVDGSVTHHTQQPCGDRAAIGQVSSTVMPNGGEGFLYGVLGATVVAADGSCQAVGASRVAVIKLVERAGITGLDLCH